MIKLIKYAEEYKFRVESILKNKMMDHILDINKHNQNIVLAFENKEIVGLAGYDSQRGVTDPFVYVLENYRRKGIGATLMRFIEDELKSYDKIVHGQLSVKDCYKDVIGFLYKMGYYDWMIGDWMTYVGSKFVHKHMEIRNYEDADYEVYHRIESTTMFLLREGVGASHNYYYPPSDNGRKYQLSNAKNSFILEVDNQVVGVADLSDHELEGVCICPMHQNKGYGTEFVRYLVNELIDRSHNEILLEAMQGNPSRSLYERLGFKDSYKTHYMVKFYGEDRRIKELPEEYLAYTKA